MEKIFLTFTLIVIVIVGLAQNNSNINFQSSKITSDVNKTIANNYEKVKPFFEKAYLKYPSIPRGILEAISFTNSRFFHISHNQGDDESCIGLPKYYGTMGLVQDGKNYFRNNLIKVSELSGISVDEIIAYPEKSIMAFAFAYSSVKSKLNIISKNIEDQIPVLVELSELPLTDDIQNNFALNSHLYSVYTFLSDKYYSNQCGFPEYTIDLKNVFGENNFQILSSGHVIISDSTITNTLGQKFINNHFSNLLSPNSSDYGPAIWNAAASCNYTVGRNGTLVSAVVVHDVEGSYAGCISWFQNCLAVVSAHYVLRSSDGQITQMVLEANKAWHVGSENPYTIGFEHEGYVAETGWYTTAMYTSSANLVRDICNSGYGISPLRTGFWPWLATNYYNSSSIPGSCTKIKGHQHYPNQTHNDPGPNWNWDYYYKLINNGTAATTLTTATGNFYDSGGSGGNYADDERKIWVISPVSATSVSLTFSSFDVENTWDYLYIYNGTDVWAPLIGYYTGTSGPSTVIASSGSMTIEFRSDCSTNSTGWAANWTSSSSSLLPTNLNVTVSACPSQVADFSWTNSGSTWYIDVSTSSSFTTYSNKPIANITSTTGPNGFSPAITFVPGTTYYWRIWNGSIETNGNSFTIPVCDIISPTTSISTPNIWETSDFTATFTDVDNVGVEKSFYQVLDFDGTYWGANSNNGFFADNFDILQPSWTNIAGVWNVNSGELTQTDETQNNSNIYAALNQTLSNRYLYHFTAKADGAGTNRRFGFHFFSDDATLTNRGNSYFVWFRIDDQSLQFYKVTNDVFTLVNTVSSVVTNTGQYYDFKITYDRILGKIVVWRDNIYLGSWTDTSPYSTNGNFISFRSGNCSMNINDLNVYRSRYPSTTITMGDNTKDIRFQNPNPSTFGAKIKSIIVDSNYNLSSIDYHDLNIDWTVPSLVSINDGTSNDVDTISDNTTASAVWTNSNDPNSGMSEYWYALGTSPGVTDIVNWTNNSLNTFITESGLNLNSGTIYYFSVKSKDGADLWSNVTSSDGFVVLATNVFNNKVPFVNVYPNPNNGNFYIETDNYNKISNISIEALDGRFIYNGTLLNKINEIKLNIPNGVYILKVYEENGRNTVQKIQINR